MPDPIRVAITGAAGNIGYAIAFRIANGDLFGSDTPVILQMLEIPPAMKALEGVAMELRDCAFPLLTDMVLSDDAGTAFDGANWAMLIGARPRSKGMERSDLLAANGAIFKPQGEALNAYAADNVRVVVVGNPANTNALIAMANAPDIPRERFSAMTRLDHNRAVSQLASKAGVPVSEIKRVTIWGNHSSTQYPDAFHATIGGAPAQSVINDDEWLRNKFIPTVQQRGAAIIEARGQSSAASAANAAINHVQSWHGGTADDDWISMGVASTGDYGSPEDVIFSYPVTVQNGEWSVVQGLELSGFDREMISATGNELLQERAAVASMLA